MTNDRYPTETNIDRGKTGIDSRRRLSTRTSRIILLSVIATGIFGCKEEPYGDKARPEMSQKAQTPTPPKAEERLAAPEVETMTEAEMRKLCDDGFNLVMQNIPDDYSSPDNMALTALSSIKRFRQSHVAWAEIRGDQYVSLESGKKGGGWMVILPRDSSIRNPNNVMFALDPRNPSLIPLKVTMAPITEEWAGIGLTHEMVHFYDLVSEAEPRNPSKDQYLAGEARAYYLERALIDQMTGGKYSKQVAKIVRESNVKNLSDILNYFDSATNRDALAALDGLITEKKPMSGNEQGLRNGFHIMAFALAIAEKNNDNEQDALGEFTTYIEGAMNL